MYAPKVDQDNNNTTLAPVQPKQDYVHQYADKSADDHREQGQTQLAYQLKANESESSAKVKTMQLLADQSAAKSVMVQLQAKADQFAKNQSVVYQLAKQKSNPKITSIFPARSSSNTLQLKGVQTEAVVQLVRYGARKPPFLNAIALLGHVVAPDYTNSGIPGAGGSHSTAVVGPNVAPGNRADPALPRAIVAARGRYAPNQLKAGHLLNAQLGGDGFDANNLTVLSAAGNRNHANFDNPVIRAVAQLRNAYEILWRAGIDISAVEFGISVSVRVNTDDTWPDERAIFTSLTCSAELSYHGPALDEIRADFNDDQGQLLADFNASIDRIDELCADATAAGDIDNPVAALPRIRRGGRGGRNAPVGRIQQLLDNRRRLPLHVQRQRARRLLPPQEFRRNLYNQNRDRDLRRARRNARQDDDE